MMLAFDSDEAGARAAERAYPFHETFPMQPVVMILPQGLDPADFVRPARRRRLPRARAERAPLVEYMFRRSVGRHDLSSVEGQSAAVAASLPILEGLPTPCARANTAHLLAELTDVSEASVILALERKMAGRPQSTSRRR